MQSYVDALISEIQYYAPLLKERLVTTLFLGGGTPSLLSGEQVRSLLNAVRDQFDVAPQIEVSLESNPGTLTEENLEGYQQAGVNRISMGVQSFQANELKWLGRTHGVDEVLTGVALLQKVGLKNFNLDLIFGLPEQTLEMWQENVRQALALASTHISLYHLTIEEGSTFGDIKKEPHPSGEQGAILFEWTKETLEVAGYEQYEISNYARPGFRCHHNEVYWRNEDCLGIGAGAWTYLNGTRYLRPKTIEAYIQDVESRTFEHLEEEILSPHDSLKETLVFGLRTKDGVDLNRLQERYGFGPDSETEKSLQRLMDQGLIQQTDKTLQLTNKGVLFADTVAVELI